MEAREEMAVNADRNYRAIGVMSGSSLDGIDLALCDLRIEKGRWNFRIEKARTVPYDEDLRSRLIAVMDGSALELARLHVELGRMIGNAINEFLSGEKIDLIASHGHTIFHKPDEGLTTQIGCGAQIAAISGITTVCDFRTMDVALGGQGAPLVPIGERLLFSDHDAFINLGGIANISIHRKSGVIGYDVGPCNMMLNLLAAEAGKEYDEGGSIARSGSVDDRLLRSLNDLSFYQKNPPRSLGREWFDEELKPLTVKSDHSLPDRMRTLVEHIAIQIGLELDRHSAGKVMITGGGAHNSFLIERIRGHSKANIELPEKTVIDFKEALIFALLGVLRLRGEVNALASVTGAGRDSVGGAVYLGFNIPPE